MQLRPRWLVASGAAAAVGPPLGHGGVHAHEPQSEGETKEAQREGVQGAPKGRLAPHRHEKMAGHVFKWWGSDLVHGGHAHAMHRPLRQFSEQMAGNRVADVGANIGPLPG
jgi:hypothetical protein